MIELDGHDILIRTVAQLTARAREVTQKFLGDQAGGSVDDFLAARHDEAQRE